MRTCLCLLTLTLLACQTPQTLTAPGRTESLTLPSSAWTQAPGDATLLVRGEGLTLEVRDVPRIQHPQGALLHTLAWLEASAPGTRIIARNAQELFVESDGAKVMYRFARGAQLDYVVRISGEGVATKEKRALWEPIVATFRPNTDTVTRAMHTAPDASVLAKLGLTLTKEMRQDPRTKGLRISPDGDAMARLTMHHALIEGAALRQTLPYETDIEDVTGVVAERMAKRGERLPTEPVKNGRGTVIVHEKEGALVPMTHVTRVLLRGTTLHQISLSTPRELFEANESFMMDLLDAMMSEEASR